MASNYTRLQNIFLELLNHDVDFKVENTFDSDLVPIKQIKGYEFSIQIDLEDMSDDAEDGIYRFFKYANVDGKREIVSEMSFDTMKELEERVINWIKYWKFTKKGIYTQIWLPQDWLAKHLKSLIE